MTYIASLRTESPFYQTKPIQSMKNHMFFLEAIKPPQPSWINLHLIYSVVLFYLKRRIYLITSITACQAI